MRQYILHIIALLFAFAVVGKISGLNVFAGDEHPTDISEPIATAEDGVDSAGASLQDNITEEESGYSAALIKEVAARKGELDMHLSQIEARKSELEVIEKRVMERLAVLKSTNEELQKRLTLVEQMSRDEMTHLSKMYEAMKPKQASIIFNKMDPIFAAGFLREINSEQAGLIMANMDSGKAYAVSVVMANSNAAFRSREES